MTRRVVVTGMGIVGAIGNNCEETTDSLRNARSGITYSEEQRDKRFRSHVYAPPTIDPFEVLDKRITRFMGQGSAWHYIATQEAIKNSGLEQKEISNERTGIIAGSGGASSLFIAESAQIALKKGPKRIGPFGVTKTMGSTASANLSVPLQIKGVCYSISSACATSSHCIGHAAELIQWGKQDVMLAGGSEELQWVLSALFDAMGALSSRFNENHPETASRAFDADRDGFVVAGGAGTLILEELEHAKARGANIIAEIVGYGANCDGHDMVAPSGEGAVRCMRQALEGVHLPVDYINPHATSTVLGDQKEIEAIREVFGDACPPISATKSLTGHSLGAAGAQEAIYTLLMMQNRFLCESAHIEQIDPQMADMPILRERKDDVPVACAVSNAFGFGGTNATLVFKHPDA